MNAPLHSYSKLTVKEPETPGIVVTKDLAAYTSYLSAIAFADATRIELSCVMLTTAGRALACNQKTLASFAVKTKLEQNVAIPLILAKELREGDVLYPTPGETIIKSGTALYSTTAPARAQKDYPVKTFVSLEQQASQKLGVCDGRRLADLIGECVTCLGQLAKTEVVLNLALTPGRLTASGENGGAKFRASRQLKSGDSTDTLRAPLLSLAQSAPLLGEKPWSIARGSEHGDMFLSSNSGWILFPAWAPAKKKKKK
jgi:hypothetical protein